MENYQDEVRQAVTVLRTAYTVIEKILADEAVMHLKNRLLRVIDKEITSISIQHGLDYEAKYSEPVVGEPLRKIMGREIKVHGAAPEKQLLTAKSVQEKAIQQSAQEIEAGEFKEKALDLYAKFSDIENEAILDQFDEMIIRGVGKIAGLPVTENHPKKITSKFIDEIKDAIKMKDSLENASKKAENDLGLNDDNDLDNDEFRDDEFGQDDLIDPPPAGNTTISPISAASANTAIPASAGTSADLEKQLSGDDTAVKKAVVEGVVNEVNSAGAGATDNKQAKKPVEKVTGKAGDKPEGTK